MNTNKIIIINQKGVLVNKNEVFLLSLITVNPVTTFWKQYELIATLSMSLLLKPNRWNPCDLIQ